MTFPSSYARHPGWGYTFSHWETQATVVLSEDIVTTGSVWKYSDTGVDLGTAMAADRL